MITHFSRFIIAGLILYVAQISTAFSAESAADPNETLREANEEGMAAIYKGPTDARSVAARAMPIMKTYFDFSILTRRAAGPHWREFTPEQQARSQALLTELAVRSYCSHFDPVVRSTITYLPPTQLTPDRYEMRTLVIYNGRDYSVNYRAERISGKWHFYDVIVEGLSLVANYRAQFDSLYQKGGAESIIQALQQTLAQQDATK